MSSPWRPGNQAHRYGGGVERSSPRWGERKLTGREETLPVTGAPVAQDALDIELGIEAGLTDTATVGAAYTDRYGDGDGHGVTAELRVAF